VEERSEGGRRRRRRKTKFEERSLSSRESFFKEKMRAFVASKNTYD
jgi:hypothetical protein